MKSRSFLTLHRQHGYYHDQGPERFQEHTVDKIAHVTSVVTHDLSDRLNSNLKEMADFFALCPQEGR